MTARAKAQVIDHPRKGRAGYVLAERKVVDAIRSMDATLTEMKSILSTAMADLDRRT